MAYDEMLQKMQYPNLILEKSPEHPNRIRVLRLNETEKELRREMMRRRAWEDAILRVGMWRVVDALRRVCGGGRGGGRRRRGTLDRTSAIFAPDAGRVDLNASQGIFDDEAEDDEGGDGGNHGVEGRSPVPLVVHNGFMDLLFLMTHFHSPELPDTLPECKELISSYFPVVYDTKVMASECSALWNNDQTILAYLYEKVVKDNPAILGSIEVVPSGRRGGGNDDEEEDGEVAEQPEEPDGQEHEAAYDAYMTGCVFAGLSVHIKALYRLFDGVDGLPHLLANAESSSDADVDEQIVRVAFGRNKLFQMSMFTIDLEEPDHDPLQGGMSPESAFRVSGIDPSVATRDIVRCMNDLVDDEGRRVNFDIIWVDDTTFIVASRYRPSENLDVDSEDGGGGGGVFENAAVLNKHGKLVYQALRNRFRNEEITSLKECFKSQRQAETGEEDEEEKPRGWFGRILGLVGLDKKRRANDGNGEDFGNEPAAKRRRQS